VDKKLNLLIFNLRVDSDHDVLGFTTEWVNGLAKNFDHVYVLTMYLGELNVSENVSVYSLGQEKGYSKLRRIFNFYRALISIIREKHIDVCFAHMNQLFVILGWPLLKFNKIPIVLWYAHGHVSLLLKIAHYCSDLIVSSSLSGFRINTNKLKIVGQGIDINRFCSALRSTSVTNPTYRILNVGRISRIKKLELVLLAFSKLPMRTKDGRILELVFVGSPLTADDREYKESLLEIVRELKLDASVKFFDSEPFYSIDRFYKEADLFINTSGTGSMDKTVLEAMASELPVVTSNVAFRQVLTEFQALCYVDSDDVLLLKNKIDLHLEMSESQRLRLGRALRSIVKKEHSFDGLCKKITKILKGCNE
jgi:glycosyltransferase involved in cell wall biosynthesis